MWWLLGQEGMGWSLCLPQEEDGKGLLMDFMLCGVIHKRGRYSPCLSFPAGKGQLNCSMQRGTGS